MKMKKYMYYPVPFMGCFGGYIVYKTIFYSGFLHIFLPTFPLAILFSIRKNIVDNCQASIENIELLQGGEMVRVKDLSGKVRNHPIESLRKATDKEIIKLNRAGGPAFVERMKDFYPVMVQANTSSIDRGRAEVREVSGDSLMDILFIDHKGVISDKHLLSAILNGRPIIIESPVSTQDSGNPKDNTIDI